MTQPTSTSGEGVVGQLIYARIDVLFLDASNPRFSVDIDDPRDQARVAKAMADKHNALDIASQIASEGFHAAEPPAVIRDGADGFIVVEGNRRVTALMGLRSPELRATFDNSARWDDAAQRASAHGQTIPDEIPVVVYPDRDSAAPLLGARHVVGQLSWDPIPKARWFSGLVDSGQTFAQVARSLGIRENDVREAYRNYRLVTKDATELGIETPGVERKFTVLGNVLDNKTLREHAKVLPESQVQAGQSSLSTKPGDADHGQGLRELFRWVLGTTTAKPVLEDSRRVVKLGQVVAVKEGLAALRAGKSLDEALQIVADTGTAPLDQATRMLTAAANSLTRAAEQIDLLEEPERLEVTHLVARARAAVTRVESALNPGTDSADTGHD